MSKKYRILHIAAIPNVDLNNLDTNDEFIPGIYIVEVDKNLKDKQAASAVMDAFHDNNGIEVLDDFVFMVFDPETGIVIDEDEHHQNGSLNGYSNYYDKLSNDAPFASTWQVQAVGDIEPCILGSVTVIAETRSRAREIAIEHLWDSGLNSAASPVSLLIETYGDDVEASLPRWFLVSGHIPGYSNIVTKVFEIASIKEAELMFESALYEDDPIAKSKRSAIKKKYGVTVLIGAIASSVSEIVIL